MTSVEADCFLDGNYRDKTFRNMYLPDKTNGVQKLQVYELYKLYMKFQPPIVIQEFLPGSKLSASSSECINLTMFAAATISPF